METNGSSSSHPHRNAPLGDTNNSTSEESSDEKNVFVNHAEMLWHEMRKQWVGDPAQKTPKMQTDPVMSWTTTYEDLLCSDEPFQQPIPLAEMVDFLVDIWHEDGLYD